MAVPNLSGLVELLHSGNTALGNALLRAIHDVYGSNPGEREWRSCLRALVSLAVYVGNQLGVEPEQLLVILLEEFNRQRPPVTNGPGGEA